MDNSDNTPLVVGSFLDFSVSLLVSQVFREAVKKVTSLVAFLSLKVAENES